MFNHTGTRIYASKASDFSDAITLTAIFRQADGMHAAKPVELDNAVNPAATYVEPTFHLQPEQAQFLMDELWDCGLRPTEGKGSAGALAATEAHLKDMRQIATQLLNDKLKGA